MNRENPRPGECWIHFKGGHYSVIAIAKYSSRYFDDKSEVVIYTKSWVDILNELANKSSFIACDTENSYLFEVAKENDNWYLRPSDNPITNKSTSRKPIAWARNLDNFMEVISYPYGSELSSTYRFSKKEDLSIIEFTNEGGVLAFKPNQQI